MTRKDVSELFGVMALAWPSAEIFRRQQDIPAAITLWARCLEDVDTRCAQEGLMRLCRESKFMPSVAEVRAAAAVERGKEDARLAVAETAKLLGRGE